MAELRRPFPLDRLGTRPEDVAVEADEKERAALAERLSIPAVERLVCRFRLRRVAPGIVAADGALDARVVQTSVVTLDDFAQDVAETFAVRFVPAGQEGGDEDPDAPDDIPYEGTALDLGEAAAEQLALALDPYPREPGAVPPEDGLSEDAPEEGTDPAAASTPFAALGKLRRT